MTKILITGGTGFIGRHLVDYLVTNKPDFPTGPIQKIRVADKVMPVLAHMNDHHKKAFESDLVNFIQSDLKRPDHVKRAFGDEEWDYVINLASETTYGKTDPIYKEFIIDVAKNVAEAALNSKCKRFIELSTAQVYKPGKKPRKENYEKIKPWTGIARAKLEVEKILQSDFKDLDYIILRPAIVYGVADMKGLTPRVVTAAAYQFLGEKMVFLWTGDMKINSVHVVDVARAIVHVLTHGEKGSIFNLADKSNLTQKKFNSILSDIFKIKTGFAGSILSKLASIKLEEMVNQANERHMEPWNEMKKLANIKNSPLSPFIELELLSNNWLSVDGSKIESTGFKYEKPEIKAEYIKETIDSFKALKIFPEVSKK